MGCEDSEMKSSELNREILEYEEGICEVVTFRLQGSCQYLSIAFLSSHWLRSRREYDK